MTNLRFVRRDDAHVAVARRDEDDPSQAADDAAAEGFRE